MLISELIANLEKAKAEHGDIQVITPRSEGGWGHATFKGVYEMSDGHGPDEWHAILAH